MGRAYSMHGNMKNTYKILVRRCERKRPLWRPDIEMDLKKNRV
jgi:hypothetical protein